MDPDKLILYVPREQPGTVSYVVYVEINVTYPLSAVDTDKLRADASASI